MRVYRGAPFPSVGPCALTIGNFDGLHLGHRTMLEQLKREAAARGLPTAVLTFEPHPGELFSPGTAPARLTNLREKLELLQAAGIDRVYLAHFNRKFASQSAEEFAEEVVFQQINAQYILIGDDFRFGKSRTGTIKTLLEIGQRLGFQAEAMHEVALDNRRCSSTAVREALAGGNLALAEALLGRPYSMSGRVIHGNKLGRQIGFPTANIQVKHNRPPLHGIFAVEVHGYGQPLQGAASLGLRPTVDTSGKVAFEVYLLDFDADIYGQHLRVNFLKKLRDEVKYAGLDPLIAQIQQDVADTRAFFAARDAEGRISIPRS